MWTPTTRQQHGRTVTRYQTDLTDAEWRVIAPHLPKPCATAGRAPGRCARSSTASSMIRAGCRGGCCRTTCRHGGTIYRWFAARRDDGCFERINHALVMADRERVGRYASPTAAIIDSQSAKTNRGRRTTRLRCRKDRGHGRARPRARTASGEASRIDRARDPPPTLPTRPNLRQ